MILSGISHMYWITRLPIIYDALLFILVVGVVVAAITGIIFLIFSYEESDDTWNKNVKKCFVTAVIMIVLSGIGLTFVPRASEALLIYGVGSTIDYIDNNDTIKQLPDKAVQALDKYLNSLNKDNENENSHN